MNGDKKAFVNYAEERHKDWIDLGLERGLNL